MDDARDYKASRAPQLIGDMADKIAAAVAKRGVANEQAAEIGVEVADQIRADWGGQAIYFPKGEALDIAQRDIEIWHKFTGFNHLALAREYDLTEIHIYRVVKAVGIAMRAKRQGQLF